MPTESRPLSPAEQLLWSYGCRKPEHIDLEAIAADKGARVVYRCMDGCAARLVADGAAGAIISVEARDNEGRQRFSLGHELAHLINDAKKSSFKCSNDQIGPQDAGAQSVEAAANFYASQLVLPDYMVAPWMAGKKMTLNAAIEMAQAFKASVTASAIKLVRRSEAAACVVCHNQRGRRWFVKSLSWPFDLYPRNELHENTAAFDLAFKATTKMSNPRKEQADHWLTGPELWGKSVESQSMKLPDDTVLTMLALIPARPGR